MNHPSYGRHLSTPREDLSEVLRQVVAGLRRRTGGPYPGLPYPPSPRLRWDSYDGGVLLVDGASVAALPADIEEAGASIRAWGSAWLRNHYELAE